jgi:hypothetical protein
MNGRVTTTIPSVRITSSFILVSELDNLSKAERSQKKWGRMLSLKKVRWARRRVCRRALAQDKTQDTITNREHRV